MVQKHESKSGTDSSVKKRRRRHTMDMYTELLEWAKDQGIRVHGIEPRRLPGRGIGIVATQAIEPDTLLLQIPISCLRTLDTIPKRITGAFPQDAPVHGLLAADLALDTTAQFAAWNAVVPTRSDVWSSLPLTWTPELHRFLPQPARTILARQTAHFERDWSLFQQAFPSSPTGSESVDRETYLYHWLLVNTRTFYHETPKTSRPHLTRDDRMVLQPVADLFNHDSDAGCTVGFDQTCFSITADGAYAAGDEVRICYGRHSNDFLLVEYGFILSSSTSENTGSGNRWDEVCIDEAVLPGLSARQKERLDEVEFLGGYVLDSETVCHRTQVALRMLVVSLIKWRAFVDGEEEEEDEEIQREVDRLLVRILKKYIVRIEERLEEIDELEAGESCQRQMLARRWRQIRGLVETTIARLEA